MGAPAEMPGEVVTLKRRRAIEVRGHRVGHIVRLDEQGVVIDYDGNPHGPLCARATVAITEGMAQACAPVLLTFEREQSDQPIIVGVLRSSHVTASALDVQVDGERVVIRGNKEILLQCGPASITLCRNGRVVVRGAYVETRSDGVNRIKGGSVKIN